jgi:hypothetical protein
MLRKAEARNRRSQARTVYKHLKGTHNKGRIAEEPGEGKRCAAGRGAESLTESRGVRRETPGSSTHLKAKAGGDKSLSEKREAREGVYRVVLRDPRDTVRAALPEPQSPAVALHTRRDHAWLRRYHERTDKLSRCVLFA